MQVQTSPCCLATHTHTEPCPIGSLRIEDVLWFHTTSDTKSVEPGGDTHTFGVGDRAWTQALVVATAWFVLATMGLRQKPSLVNLEGHPHKVTIHFTSRSNIFCLIYAESRVWPAMSASAIPPGSWQVYLTDQDALIHLMFGFRSTKLRSCCRGITAGMQQYEGELTNIRVTLGKVQQKGLLHSCSPYLLYYQSASRPTGYMQRPPAFAHVTRFTRIYSGAL